MHKAIGTQAHGVLLKLVTAYLFGIALRDDPAHSGRRRGVEGQKIRPGRMQLEAHMVGGDNLDGFDLVFQLRCSGAFVALEAEVDIVGREGIPIVKRHPLAQRKIIRQAVRALVPGRGEAGGHGVSGHRFHQGIVEGVHEDVGGHNPWRLRRIKPGGRNIQLNRPGHLPTRFTVLGGRGPVPRPARLPGGQPGHTTQRALEHASSGQGRDQLRGTGSHITPPGSARIGRPIFHRIPNTRAAPGCWHARGGGQPLHAG